MTSLLFLAVWIISQAISTYVIVRHLRQLGTKQSTEKPIEAFVTPTNPAFIREDLTGQGDSIIVTPKSPQLIEWEENEKLRKMNLRPL